MNENLPKLDSLTDQWRLIERFYPDYSHSNDVYRSDILDKYFCNEMGNEDLVEHFGTNEPDRNELQKEREELDGYLFTTSLKEFAKKCREMTPQKFAEYVEEPIEPSKDEEEVIYILFGGDASNELMLNDFEEAVENIQSENMMYKTLAFTKKKDDPTVLLECFDGYNGYTILTKEQYEVLNNL